MLTKRSIFSLFFALCISTAGLASDAHAKTQTQEPNTFSICPKVSLHHRSKIPFSSNEKKLICGDEKYPAWVDVPHNQTTFLLKGFLQARGYHSPVFSTEGDLLVVNPGEQTFIENIVVEGEPPPSFRIDRKRKYRHRVLTPERINEIEGWSKQQLNNIGFPCPKVTVKGIADTGEVVLTIMPGTFQRYTTVAEEPMTDLDPGVLNRFHAFTEGEPFNGMRNTLTADRMELDGIVQNAHLVSHCDKDGKLSLSQEVILGRPRLFMTGFGANTEGLLLFKTSLRIARIDRLGSATTLSLFGSFRKQEFRTDMDWYLLRPPSRWYLHPSITFTREDEDQYELVSTKIQMGPAAKFDRHGWHLFLDTGPRWTWTRSFKGSFDENTYFFSGIANLRAMTHDYEFFQTSPRSGFLLDASVNLNHRGLLSDATAQRLSIEGEALWNVKQFDPPLWVWGFRFGLKTTLIDRSSADFSRLPPNFLHFLGGSSSLRGFGRGELPRETTSINGALTTAFAGLEGRLVEVLPWGFQPFAFIDVGATGAQSTTLDSPIFWSPGGGIRWQSPIGVFRTTFAHGFVSQNTDSRNDSLSHFQFYLSYGEEF